ncbi:DNA alkylation repair protein [Dysgonomonas sp. ZJ279]|uniref:DNA alkylation repair protein n=1 Tax=Dysgonomonas sp. ZJ279 TaxID=2709796 RepID=UPI0013E9B44C|nr:DNA alkylation repair protein [Dysgonomonas sp. ZJ279]
MEISQEILKRKGALKFALLSPDIINLLNRGLIASVNLTEWLAVDHGVLVKNVLPHKYQESCLSALANLKQKTAMQSTLAVGKALHEQTCGRDSQLLSTLAGHVSDSVRCWATYLVGLNDSLNISEKLNAIKPFAADSHFGVREISWMAMRYSLDSNLEQAIAILLLWVQDENANVRRFATEAIRPRGVWCKHIDRLKEEPRLALPILDVLKSDPSKYVQDSVGNWLNDASKTQPDWVVELCEQWGQQSNTKETTYIIKKALRSIS